MIIEIIKNKTIITINAKHVTPGTWCLRIHYLKVHMLYNCYKYILNVAALGDDAPHPLCFCNHSS